MSMCFVFFLQLIIREVFVGFVQVDDVSARGIADSIIGFMKSVGLDTSNLRGQAYDGASVMAGIVAMFC